MCLDRLKSLSFFKQYLSRFASEATPEVDAPTGGGTKRVRFSLNPIRKMSAILSTMSEVSTFGSCSVLTSDECPTCGSRHLRRELIKDHQQVGEGESNTFSVCLIIFFGMLAHTWSVRSGISASVLAVYEKTIRQMNADISY